nr:MAG TPA: hypothetical protein [Caudoviricetes sp.]
MSIVNILRPQSSSEAKATERQSILPTTRRSFISVA